ncbi:MAG: SGNH/GDSL hydrolase family protein [bacterium]
MKSLRPWILNFLLVCMTVLVCLGGIELAFRLRSLFTQPTVADKQREFIETLTIPYSYGVVRPHARIADLRDYFPTGKNIPGPVPIATNSFGLRMREISLDKPSDTIRVAVMGDSCTFGWMVREEDAYPRVLERLLNENSTRRYEVLNFGVPGYTSYHGWQQYRRLVKPFAPDILILAYGFNDSYESRFPEHEFHALLMENHLAAGLSGAPWFVFDHSRFGAWLIGRFHSRSQNAVDVVYHQRAAAHIWHPRVSREEYRQNLTAITQDAAQSGARTILVNLDLPNSWARDALPSLAQSLDIPWVDIREQFEQLSGHEEEQKRQELKLKPPGPRPAADPNQPAWLFRVWIPEDARTEPGVHLVFHHQDPANWPRYIPLFDDATHGDEQAGDRVWSRALTVDELEIGENTALDYMFLNGRLPGDPPVYENTPKAIRFYHRLDLRDIPPGSDWTSPVHLLDHLPFGQLLIPGDPIHPNGEGHQVIAEMLAEVVRGEK